MDGYGTPAPGDGSPPAGDHDVRLTGRVAAALAGDERLRGQDLTVQVQHAVAILGGTVDDAALHDVVTGHARGVPGVRDVCDGLVVRSGPATGPSGEAALFGELAARLAVRPAPAGPRVTTLGPRSHPRVTAVLTVLRRTAVVTALLAVLIEVAGGLVALFAIGVVARLADLLWRRRKRR